MSVFGPALCLFCQPILRLRCRKVRADSLTKHRLVVTRNVTIVVEAGAVSRFHAKVTRKVNDFSVEDAGSRNGTFLNGRMLQSAASRFVKVIAFVSATWNLFFITKRFPSSLSPVRR